MNIKPLKECPVLDKIRERFAVDERTLCITYFPNLYADASVDPILLAHEQIHLKQQEKIGAEKWWKQYLKDDNFLKNQESEAYRDQAKFVKEKVKDRNLRARILHKLVTDFSGEMYGGVISREEAENVIIKTWP